MSPSPIFPIAWVALDLVIFTEAWVPLAFTEDDILHYVVAEQAQLFPTLDQAIYFDFLVKEVEEENKKITQQRCFRRGSDDIIFKNKP